MVAQIRSSTRVRKYGFNPLSIYCTTPYWPNSQTVIHEYESVDSYRGKPFYINVGSKRRKVFNAFTRYRYRMGDQTAYKVCVTNTNPKYIGWVQDFPLFDIKGKIDKVGFRNDEGVAWSGDVPPMFFYPLAERGEELIDPVIRDMFVKLQAPKFGTATFLAELEETLLGIRGLFEGCIKSVVRPTQGISNIRHLMLNPHELWLWWRYALMPTMMDVEDIIKAFEPEGVVDRVQSGDRSNGATKSFGEFRILGYNYGNTNIIIPREADVRYGCGSAIDISMRRDPHPWGLGPWDVLMATWEIIPFSFIFDWFVNVGDWLASWRKVEFNCHQSYATYSIESNVKILGAAPYVNVYGTPSIETHLMIRTTNIEPPTLPLVDKRWRNIKRTIDLISLSIGFLKGILRRR